jgi:hypothetical protein
MLLSALRVFAVRMVLCLRTFTARITKAHKPRFKGSNGAVAVGLPHRNRSVIKHGPLASEAKGPLPSGKRVGSREKRKLIFPLTHDLGYACEIIIGSWAEAG